MENNRPINWEKLEDDFSNKRSVVLFLGTGIDFGAPLGINYSWDALLNHLLKYAVMQMLPGNDLGKQVAKEMSSSSQKLGREIIERMNEKSDEELKAKIKELKEQIDIDFQFPRDVKSTMVKQTLGNEAYVGLIQDFLYGKMGKKDVEEAGGKYVEWLNNKEQEKPAFFSLFSVADMILRNRNIRAVVTQNYDQFLFEALKYLNKNTGYLDYYGKNEVRKIEPNVICDWKGQESFTYDDINIYHVHGFIPRYDAIQAPKDNRIVLSLDEFYEDSRNVYSWQIASQLHFLSQYTCIFCGLSLEDYTNQRLLHYVRGKHHGNLYYITADITSGLGGEKTRLKDSLKNKFHENNGLTVLYDEHGFSHIYQLLGELKYGRRN